MMMNTTTKGNDIKSIDETREHLMQEGLSVLQKRDGYRFSIDAILLAGFIRLHRRSRAVELGSGSGVISMVLAYRDNPEMILGLEIQKHLAEMATRSACMSGLEGRVRFETCDIRNIRNCSDPERFDAAFFNPPYRKIGTGKINPHSEKATARHELQGTIGDFVRAAAFLVREKGRIFVIYSALRSVTLMEELRRNRIEPKRIQYVYSEAGSPARFILAEGVKGAGEELTVLPPLTIYHSPGVYSTAMELLFSNIPVRIEDSGSTLPES